MSKMRVALILVYFAFLAFNYARTIPLFEASDEAEHFIYIQHLLERGELPVIQSRADMATEPDPVWRWNNQAHHAPLYYLLSAALVSWSERADLADYLRPNELIFLRNTTENNPNKWLHPYGTPSSDTHIAVYFLRGFSVLIGCGTLILVYLTGKQVFSGDFLPLLLMFFVASLPTFIVVNSNVTNDALVIFFYTAGILWSVRVLNEQALKRRDALLISLILAGISLTKLTGVSLFGVVYLSLLVGLWRKVWSWRQVLETVFMTVLAFGLLAAWWYLRNWQVYGDPLALTATASIWGRETPLTWAIFQADSLRIVKSLWMMVGYLHEPVYAPHWFYAYVGLVVILAILGYLIYGIRGRSTLRPYKGIYFVLISACLIVTGMLLWGTRSVDISYGRLLLPAVSALGILLLQGLVRLVPNRGEDIAAPLQKIVLVLCLLPLAGMALYAPFGTIPQAYPRLILVDTIPDSAIPIHWQADNLTMLAADIQQTQVSENGIFALDLYLEGSHYENPALLVTIVDTANVQRLAHLEIYAGMAATDQLPEGQIYRLPLRIPLMTPETVLAPRIAAVLIEWVNLEDNRKIEFDSGLSLLEIWKTTLVDSRYHASRLATPLQAEWGNQIRLETANLPSAAQAGETIQLEFVWLPLLDFEQDWTLTLQLFDENGDFITQADGMPYWYPTSAWVENIAFFDSRDFPLPADLPIGTYTVRMGWYRAREDGSFERLPLTQGIGNDNLLVLPVRIHIEGEG